MSYQKGSDPITPSDISQDGSQGYMQNPVQPGNSIYAQNTSQAGNPGYGQNLSAPGNPGYGQNPSWSANPGYAKNQAQMGNGFYGDKQAPSYPYQVQPGPFIQPAPKKKRFAGPFFIGLGSGILLAGIIFMVILVRNPIFSTLSQSGGLTVEEGAEMIQKTDVLVRYIDEMFYTDVDNSQILDGAYHGAINGLNDKYASYFNQKEYTDYMESASGNYVGIGVTVSLAEEEGGAMVEDVNPMGGAFEAGIQVGDRIVKADDADLTGLTLDQIVSHIRGDEGTSVEVTFIRDGQPQTVSIVRRQLESITVRSGMLPGNIGYLSLAGFEGTTTGQFQTALEDLKNQGMKSMVLDLRDNPGGRVDVVTAIADEMMDAGMITYIEDKTGYRENFYSSDNRSFDMPLVVLVNENSASASELLSGALQARGFAKLVGTTTFGKGIVQTTVPLYDASAVKLTTARYYLPDGRCIHGEGVQPDYVVELPENETLNTLRGLESIPDLRRDTQLQKALELLGVDPAQIINQLEDAS